MNLFSYLKSLVPIFKKSEIAERIESILELLEENTIPPWETASTSFGSAKLKNPDVIELTNILKSVAGFKRDIYTEVHLSLVNAAEILKLVQEYTERIFMENEASNALTYAKATAMRTIDTADFCSNYARRLINYILSQECKELLEDPESSQPSPAEIKWLNDHAIDAASGFKALRVDKKKFKEYLETMPEAIVSEMSEISLKATLGVNKVDPMGFINVNTRWSPGHLYALYKADKDAQQYQAAVAEYQTALMRIMQLQKLNAKQNDAGLEAEIKRQQNISTRYASMIRDMEKEYGL